jgi:hypothetical protein
VALEHPGVRRFVPQRLVALGGREVRGDRDAVRRTVSDLASGELSLRKADHGRPESEPRRQTVVQPLQVLFGIGRRQGEEKIQAK